jgi:hypothetical protein
MKVASVDAASLADQAGRCRRLAVGIGDGDTKVTLLALAAEYEAKMLVMKNGQPGARARASALVGGVALQEPRHVLMWKP